jgi:hypothetical protein
MCSTFTCSYIARRCTRLASASDKVYQLLAHGRWFSPGTPASFTTKTGCHDIAEILLKVALKHQKSKSGEVYSIQHYVIKFVGDLQQVSGFLQILWFPPPIKPTAMI